MSIKFSFAYAEHPVECVRCAHRSPLGTHSLGESNSQSVGGSLDLNDVRDQVEWTQSRSDDQVRVKCICLVGFRHASPKYLGRLNMRVLFGSQAGLVGRKRPKE